MKQGCQLLAALMLLAWLFAGGHLVLEHGGESIGVTMGEETQHGHHHHHHDDGSESHHDDGPARHDDDDHHHDLTAASGAPLLNFSDQRVVAPQWAPLFERLTAELVAALRVSVTEHEHSVYGESPPDERASGWLLIVQTARPVRGPSLAA